MLAFVEFNPQLITWSAFTFWTVAISIAVTLVFTAVVFIGGIGDLRFLLRSLDQPDEESLGSADGESKRDSS